MFVMDLPAFRLPGLFRFEGLSVATCLDGVVSSSANTNSWASINPPVNHLLLALCSSLFGSGTHVPL